MKVAPSQKSLFVILIITLSGLLLLSLSVYKAAHTAFTHDESFTYLSYVKKSVVGIVSMEEPVSANNHILNTLCMKVIDKIAEPTPFNLRIPNILAYAVFLIFSALLVLKIKDKLLALTAFFILIVNLFVFDFFSISRGYGISLALLMVHFYFLKQFLENTSHKKQLIYCVLTLVFAVYSSFSTLYYVAALLAVVVVNFVHKAVKQQQNNYSKYSAIVLLGGFLLLLLVGLPLYKLITHDQLYFGGTTSVFHDTIYSLVFYSVSPFGPSETSINTIYYCVIGIVLLLSIAYVFQFYKPILSSFSHALSGTLLFVFFIQIVLFYLIGNKFLIERTALFIIPVFLITLIFVCNDLFGANQLLGKVALAFSSILLLYSLVHINLKSTIIWRYDADNELMLNDLYALQKQSNNIRKLKLGIDWIFEPSINFYRITQKKDTWLEAVDKNGYENTIFDYYFVEAASLGKFADTTQFKIIKHYPISTNCLIKNLHIE